MDVDGTIFYQAYDAVAIGAARSLGWISFQYSSGQSAQYVDSFDPVDQWPRNAR
jgi:hypothetical protein